MFQIISLLGLGFLLGLEHALDSDHIAAISTISSKTNSTKKAIISGLYWGIGHTGILIFTGILVLSSHFIIPAKIAKIFETIVGLMLIFLGFKNILGYKKNLAHEHKHGKIHGHPYKEEHEKIEYHRSLWIGIVHGLAGSAALMLVILTTIKSFFAGMLYIAIFGLGTIMSMGFINFLMSIPRVFIEKKYPKIQSNLAIMTGCISIGIGIQHIISLY